ncbi:MAG: helix-turn-helix transcriptional regulator [Deltaproteobacteria bacterium]|nr:helix-turn-helix transcriptional regulator [Deltaproteobacteria bacterium]
MRSSLADIMPPHVRRSLKKLGEDFSIARRKRRLTIAMMCERLGVSKATWQRIEKGDPSVSMGAYAQALFVLGFGTPLDMLIDPRNDEHGLLLDVERLPKRVVPPGTRKRRS